MSIEKIKPFIVDASQNFTFNGVTVTGNILSDNAHLGNYVEANYISGTLVTGAQPNITAIGTLANLSVTDTVTAGTIKTDSLLHANGDVWSTGAGGNASAYGSNTQVQFNDAGAFGATSNFTFNKITNTLTVTNYVGNGAALTNLNGANVTGQVANALVAGTVYTNAQPNITSVGTLASLSVTGNINSGNANLGNLVVANYFSGAGNNLSNIQGANVTGAVAFATTANSVAGANVSGQVSYAATANAVAGSNVFGSVSNATFATTAGTVAGANVTGQVANSLVAGTVYTNAQPNITSVGNLSSLTVDNGSYGNVVITQFASIFATGNGPNPRAIYQATAADGVTGIGIQAYSGLNGQIYANTGIIFTTGATIRDKDYPTGGTTRATIDSTGLSVTGNVTGNYIIGNGSQLTGLPAGYTDANVAAYLPTYTGNLSAGNITTAGSSGNISGANWVIANYFSGSGNNLSNIQGANVSGQVSNAATLNGYSATYFATAAQGTKADTAIQSGANISVFTNDSGYLVAANLTTYATKTYVDNGIANLVASAPAALDTLNELANALGNDASYSTTITNALANKLSTSNFASTANTWISTQTTSNLAEGTDLYFTATRANSAIDTRVTKSFVDGLAVVANVANIAYSVNGANVSGQVANALVAGTVYTNAQPNITSVGTLSNLAVAGTLTVGNVVVSATGIQLNGSTGTLGQLLTATGTGNVAWTNKFFVGNVPPAAPNYGDIWYYVDDTLSPPMAKLYMWVTDGGSDYFYDFLPPTF